MFSLVEIFKKTFKFASLDFVAVILRNQIRQTFSFNIVDITIALLRYHQIPRTAMCLRVVSGKNI